MIIRRLLRLSFSKIVVPTEAKLEVSILLLLFRKKKRLWYKNPKKRVGDSKTEQIK